MTKKPDLVDMSPEAIAGRLEMVRQLNRLMYSLAEAKLIGPVQALPKRDDR